METNQKLGYAILSILGIQGASGAAAAAGADTGAEASGALEEVVVTAQRLHHLRCSSLSTDSGQFVITEVPQRPRVLGLKMSYRFAGH